ncbi:MAG: D-isomer specific 2-hydroxyacid dehydrogenase family protein [Corynebacterium sp.]|nr:D-isomer specific 2-hydroxyacid dehydrogenase family protein [Corynebacterium sp.]
MKYFMGPRIVETAKKAIDAAGHEQVDAIEDAQAFVNTTPHPHKIPEIPDNIEFVQHFFTGVEGLISAGIITQDGVPWCNTAGGFARPVAESALALLLAQAHQHKRFTLEASWENASEIDKSQSWLYTAPNEDPSHVVIFGAGGIARELIKLLRPFGCRITAVNRSGQPVDGADATVAFHDAESLWAEGDFIVLIMPLTPETEGIVDRNKFKQMKNSAIVVNVGRGKLINTDDLVEALRAGDIAGAALEVVDPEPLPDGHPLYEIPNCTMTPHMAASEHVASKHVGPIFNANAKAWENGEALPTRVDVSLGY